MMPKKCKSTNAKIKKNNEKQIERIIQSFTIGFDELTGIYGRRLKT